MQEWSLVKHQERLTPQTNGRRGGVIRVQEKFKNKRKAKKVRDAIKDDVSKLAYETAKKKAKREVAKARKKNRLRKIVRKIGNKGWADELFKIAKQRDKQSKDVHQVRVIKSNNGKILVEETKEK